MSSAEAHSVVIRSNRVFSAIFYSWLWLFYTAANQVKLEQVDGMPSHIPAPAPSHIYVHIRIPIGLGGSVGCAVRLETRRLRVQPPPRSATFFRGDWSWNIFYGHSLPSTAWRLIMKYFLRSFSPFRWFKKGSCQFLAKECAQYWLTA